MASYNINVYTNNNTSHIGSQMTVSINSYTPKSIKYGSIMNAGLTGASSFKNTNGWQYYNSQTKLSTATQKDIMLNSSGGKPFSLLNGNVQSADYYSRRQYYSKAYREWVKTNIGEERYKNWLPGLQKEIE